MSLRESSEISRHLEKNPLIDLRESNVSYESNDFYHYFDSTMDAFDEFYKKYNLIVLKGNREYNNFPEDKTKRIDFRNMEHAVGLSSFGKKDVLGIEFLDDMLNCIHLESTTSDIISHDDENRINTIIDYWKNYGQLESTLYDFINMILLKYKDVDDFKTQEIMFNLSKIILEKAFSNKADLLVYSPSINRRKEQMLDDLVYFIDNIDNDRIKNILFNNNNFKNSHVDGNNYNEFDEKSLVIGYFANYLSSKYNINESYKDKIKRGESINIGEFIDEAKERYFDFYTTVAINNMMIKRNNSIKRKINSILNPNNDNTVFNKIIDDYINKETLSILNRNNIHSFLSILDNNDLDINNMIIINNMRKEFHKSIEDSINEFNSILEELNTIEIKYIDLIIDYQNKTGLDESTIKDRIETIARNKRNFENYSDEEKSIIEIHKRKKVLNNKLKSLDDYVLNLISFQEKSKDYDEKIKNKIKSLLKDYIDNKEISKDDYLVIQDIVDELFHDNYKESVIRELKYKKNVSSTFCETKNLDGLDPNITDKLKLHIVKHSNEMAKVFEGLYDEENFDNDYEKALQLVSEVSDRYALNKVIDLKKKGHSIYSIIRDFKNNKHGISLINLQHALMKNMGVESFLKNRFECKDGLSINYIKLMYKCCSLLSIDEIVTSRVKVGKTVEKFEKKGIDLTDQEKNEIKSIVDNNKYPYIMFIGGVGNTKTVVYFEIDDNNNNILVPLHAMRIDNNDNNIISVILPKRDLLDKNGEPLDEKPHYLPNRHDMFNSGIEFTSSKPTTIIGGRT